VNGTLFTNFNGYNILIILAARPFN